MCSQVHFYPNLVYWLAKKKYDPKIRAVKRYDNGVVALIIDPEAISKAFRLKTRFNSGYTFVPMNPAELKKKHDFLAKVRSLIRLSYLFKDPDNPCMLLLPTLRICLGFGLRITLK